MNKKISTGLSFGVIAVLSIILIGLVGYFWSEINKTGNLGNTIARKNKLAACTEEAKICPDGSTVGRTQPNCDFAPCPDVVGIANKIIISSPKSNDLVTSPISIKGKAVGTWFFEGDFPIEIYDSNNKKIGSAAGKFIPQSEDDTWMTEDMVNFEGELKFNQPQTETGYILFKKDNPSDLPTMEEAFKLPVKFLQESSQNSLDWRSYQNEKLGFSLGLPESWKGYSVSEDNQGVCFSFKDGHMPFCIMTIRVMTKDEWNAVVKKSALTKITEDDGKVYVCDSCCGQEGEFGGGQFDQFQQDRCDEAGEILQTFKLLIN